MNPYFSYDTAQAALLQVSAHWMDTPFAGHQCVLGAGVDCIHLAASIYVQTGVLSSMPNFGHYNLDGGMHSVVDRIADWMLRAPQFRLVWADQPPAPHPETLPGDLLCFSLGRQPWHCGVMLDRGDFVAVNQGSTTKRYPLGDPTWSRRLTQIWRPMLA